MRQGMARSWMPAAVAAVALTGLHLAAPPRAMAQALLSEADARTALQRDYGVEVLRVREEVIDGAPAFRITVMNPEGNFNEAFQVNVLMIDRRSGKLISQYRQGSEGAVTSAPAGGGVSEDVGPTLRRETLR